MDYYIDDCYEYGRERFSFFLSPREERGMSQDVGITVVAVDIKEFVRDTRRWLKQAPLYITVGAEIRFYVEKRNVLLSRSRFEQREVPACLRTEILPLIMPEGGNGHPTP